MTSTTFVGAGNIARALMCGYLKSQAKVSITASDPNMEQLKKLPAEIRHSQDNNQAIVDADAVVLCLKPNLMAKICQEFSVPTENKLFISVAAGITVSSLSQWLGQNTAIIRCMPNTPALVQQGMTGLYANTLVSPAQKLIAEEILGSVGQIHWFDDESELDAVTAVSGSGPAYYFLVMEAMQKAAESLGLSPAVARQLVLQTALGAAQMAQQSEFDPEQLRLNVTSPGGTTEAAINNMQNAGLTEIFRSAIEAAHNRSKALSKA